MVGVSIVVLSSTTTSHKMSFALYFECSFKSQIKEAKRSLTGKLSISLFRTTPWYYYAWHCQITSSTRLSILKKIIFIDINSDIFPESPIQYTIDICAKRLTNKKATQDDNHIPIAHPVVHTDTTTNTSINGIIQREYLISDNSVHRNITGVKATNAAPLIDGVLRERGCTNCATQIMAIISKNTPHCTG